MRITTTEEAREVLNNPGKRKTTVQVYEVGGMLETAPIDIPLTIAADSYALQVWSETLPSLIEVGMIHSNDLRAFEIYCTAMGAYQRAAQQLATEPLIHELYTNQGIQYRENPLIGIMNKMHAMALKAGKEFGLTPLSRGNVKVAKAPKKSKLSEFVQ